MLLHAADNLLLFNQAPVTEDVHKTSKLRQRNVAVVAIANTAISRFVFDLRTHGPNDLAIAFAAQQETLTAKRGADDLLHCLT